MNEQTPLQGLIDQWRASEARLGFAARSDALSAGKMLAFKRCADELEAILTAEAATLREKEDLTRVDKSNLPRLPVTTATTNEAIRAAFRAGFMAAPDPEAETFRWVFDGWNIAADREESAWEAWSADKQEPVRTACDECLDARRALLSALRHAVNGWACYAKRKIEHDEIARLHSVIAALTGDGNQQPRRSAVDPVADRGQEGSTRVSESSLLCSGSEETTAQKDESKP